MPPKTKTTKVQIMGFGLNFYNQLGVCAESSSSSPSRRRPLSAKGSPTKGLVRPTGTPRRTDSPARARPLQNTVKESSVLEQVTTRLAKLETEVELAVERENTNGDTNHIIGNRALLPVKLDIQQVLEDGNTIEEIACGANFSVALTKKGSMYRWGVDNGAVFQSPTQVPTGIPLRCTQVACGRKHSVALMEGGFVMSWGVGYFGQLGHGDNVSYSIPKLINRLDPHRLGTQIVKVCCGGYHAGALAESGVMFMWGFNRYGQCGNGVRENTVSDPLPCDLKILTGRRISQISLGRHHSAVLAEDGQVYTWGSSSFGRLGLVDPEKYVCSPQAVLHLHGASVTALASGDFHMLALTSQGLVYSWGYGAEGQCGHGSALHLRTPRVVEFLTTIYIRSIAAGAWWSMAITSEEDLYAWGCADGGWTGLERPINPPNVEAGPTTEKYSATCCFDSFHNALLPERVDSLVGFRTLKVVCGGSHSFVFVEPREGETEDNDHVGTDLQLTPNQYAESKYSDQDSKRLRPLTTDGKFRFRLDNEIMYDSFYHPLKDPEYSSSSPGRRILKALGERHASVPMLPDFKADGKAAWDRTIQNHENKVVNKENDKSNDKEAYQEYIRQVFSFCRHNRLEEVDHALESGFSIDTRDENGNTLLMTAAQNGLKQMARLCLRYRSDINYKNNRGNTALHFCFGFGNIELGEYLLSKGGDDTMLNDEGLTCYEGTSRAALEAL